MAVKERTRPVYEATLYFDEAEDAATNSRELGYFSSRSEAARAINEAREKDLDKAQGWFTGGIRYGFLHPEVFGQSPEWFEVDDREVPWFVETDGRAVQ
jgi:hypothetical protein